MPYDSLEDLASKLRSRVLLQCKLANTYEDYDKGKNQHQHQKDGKKDSKDQEMSRKKTSNFGGGESHHLSKKELAAKMKAGQCFICD